MVPRLRSRKDIAHSDRLVASLLNARSTAHELLDGEQLDPLELRKNLREMAMLNRLPGGIGDSVRAVEWLLGEQTEATVLDVGDRLRGLRAAAAPREGTWR